MNDNQAKYPQLRFKGFVDPWEQRKLSDLTERVTRKNKNNESSRPLTISAQDGLIDQNDFFDKQIASRDVSGYFLVKNGEFAYNKSYSNGYPWGAIKRLDKYDMGVLSTLYIIFRPTNVSSQFLVSYYDTTRWYKEVSKNAAEGARNHGLLNIAPTDFFSTVLLIPNSIKEQQKIGSFFKQLDDTITLHQRKLAKLKELKQGYLQKLFPQNGSKFPQLRFAGFADAWEQRKLSDAVDNIGTGKSKYMLQEKSDLAKYEVLGSTSVIGYDEDYNHEGDFILTARVGANAGNLYHHSGKVKITDNTVFIQGKNLAFIYNLLTQFDLKKLSFGTGQPLVKASELKNLILYFPNNDEQAKIGSYFKQLDHLITLHQRKLEKLQELKKGYLQKMFC
ncbi:restriction endonuclease subunit S [Levilactobacillus brevis]|uniref:restriction endonuclease subunit S n=1 Tax=Levilactobacillus brevis TaxID=1580 RepID=UPI001F4011A2|nr:restriction endonuclease subunit S [Levilactobacillus brevis]MCE6011749.1 restriction endonuclease subunit S [Levilactobacillus brevis]MCE6037132.1 restriction endonuclease subunit S [Levilactobacillus brevis]